MRETATKLECFKFFRTSALNGYNVFEGFNFLMNELIKNAKIKEVEKRNLIKLNNKHRSTHAKCCWFINDFFNLLTIIKIILLRFSLIK